MPTAPEVLPLLVPLVDGRQASIGMPVALKDFPSRVKLEIISTAADRTGYFLVDRWNYGSVQARSQVRNEANLHDSDLGLILSAMRDWIINAKQTIERSLNPPPSSERDDPYGILQRALSQPSANAQSYPQISQPHDVATLLGHAKNLPADTLLEWPKEQLERLLILDLDFHKADRPKPSATELDALGYNLSPAPWCWWITQGGGLHAMYAPSPNSALTAVELASGAVAQLLTDPVVVRCGGSVELITRTRHPQATQKGLRCGPVHPSLPDESFECLAMFSASGATDAEIQEVLDNNGLAIGQRLGHDFCLIDPGHASHSQSPVIVAENGLYCHSCAGRHGNGWMSWAFVRSKHGLDSTAVNTAEPIMQAVRNFVQFSHVDYLFEGLAPHIPRETRLPLYAALLKKQHGATAVERDQRIDMALRPFPFVRGVTGWLHEQSLAMAKPALHKDDVVNLAYTVHPTVEGELKPSPVKLTMLTRDGIVDGWYPILADNFSPFFGIHNRVHQNRSKTSALVANAWDTRANRHAVRYLKREDRVSMEEAEKRISDYFPGINLLYLKALMIAVGCADSNRGMVPMIWASGETGSAKTTTALIVSQMFNEGGYHSLSNIREERLDQLFGEKLSITRLILFDDCAKDPKGYNDLLTFILRIQRVHTSHQMYIGGVAMPVRSAILLTDKRTPAFFFGSSQFGRRVHTIQLEGQTPEWEKMGRRVEGWWTNNDDALRCGAESYFSHIVDEFFPEGDDEGFAAKMERIGVQRICDSRSDDFSEDALAEMVRGIALAICEAPKIAESDERRLGFGVREVSFGSGSPLGKRCLDLVEMQGPVTPDYDSLLHGLESFDSKLRDLLGLVCPAKFQVKQYGRRVFVRMIETGLRAHAPTVRVNRELFASWPPSFASTIPPTPTVPALPMPAGMLPPSASPTLNLLAPAPSASRFFIHPESDSYVEITPADWEAFSQSSEAALCVEIDEANYRRSMAGAVAAAANRLIPAEVDEAPSFPGHQTIFLDYETQSACNLKKHGSYVYAEHVTTRVLCAAIRIGTYRAFWTEERWNLAMPPGVEYLVGRTILREMIESGPTCLVIHNMNFERPITTITLGLPEPAMWLDTMDTTLSRGLPAGADQAGEYLLGMGKDIEGYKLMMKTCKPSKKGEMPVVTDAIMQRYIPYNFRDVDISVGIAGKFGLQIEPAWEFRANQLHQAINHFGIRIDRQFAETLRSFDETFKVMAGEHVEKITNGAITRADLGRNDFIRGWLGSHKLVLDNMRADNIEKLLDAYDEGEDEARDIPAMLIDVLKDRMVATRAAMAKVDTALRCASSDGRMHAQFRYYGAHTGRWSGYQFQPQNLKRPSEDFDLPAAIEAVERADLSAFAALCRHKKTGKPLPPYELLSSLVRGLIVPEPGKVLMVGDFSQIEARMLLWLAEDWENMQEHLDFDAGKGPDVYCTLASTVYGKVITKKEHADERQAGKIGQLACLAEGTPVLTPRGWMAIEVVTADDLVWDGLAWVRHEGLVDRGVKECIEIDGVWMTRDHEVLTTEGWKEAGCLTPRQRFLGSAMADGRCSLAGLQDVASADVSAALRPTFSRATCSAVYRPAATCAPSSAQRGLARHGRGTLQSSRIARIAVDFSTGTTRLSVDAPIHRTLGFAATAVEESRIASRTNARSWSTWSRCPGGMIRAWRSIVATTTDTTSLGTSGSSRTANRPGTPARLGGFASVVARGRSVSSANGSAPRTGTTTPSFGSSTPASRWPILSSSSDSAAVRTVRTYDLANAGPRHRFQVGTLIVHNCGYGGAEGAINRFAYALDIDLAAANVTATGIKEAWRNKHPKAVRLWHDYEWAAKRALEFPGRTFDAGRCSFRKLDGDLYITLPSGRSLHYHNCRLEKSTRSGWEDTTVIAYDSAVKGRTIRHETYGGKITENIDQAICRDLLVHAMLNLADENFIIPLHVHDEVGTEEDENLADERRKVMEQIMCTAPSWAPRMPVVAKPHVARRYGK